MTYMTLNKTYSVGMPSIDDEHRELMDLINQIHEALRAPASRDEVRKLFQRLTACAAAHFRHEEQQFSDIGYPDALLHTRKHEHLTMVLSCFQRGTDRMGQPVSFEDQLDFLRDWLLDHIANEDQQVVDYLDALKQPSFAAAR